MTMLDCTLLCFAAAVAGALGAVMWDLMSTARSAATAVPNRSFFHAPNTETHTHTHTYTHTHTTHTQHSNTHIHTHSHPHAHTYTLTRVRARARTHTHTPIHIHAHTQNTRMLRNDLRMKSQTHAHTHKLILTYMQLFYLSLSDILAHVQKTSTSTKTPTITRTRTHTYAHMHTRTCTTAQSKHIPVWEPLQNPKAYFSSYFRFHCQLVCHTSAAAAAAAGERWRVLVLPAALLVAALALLVAVVPLLNYRHDQLEFCICAFMNGWTYLWMRKCMNVCVWVCMYTCICILCIYMHLVMIKRYKIQERHAWMYTFMHAYGRFGLLQY